MGLIGKVLGAIGGNLPIVGNLIQGIIDSNVQKRNVDKTIQANKEMAQYSYSKDLEMWNRQNQYNTPEAQMQRLTSAGLNPNLVYGSGSVAGNVTGQYPKYNAPTMEYNYKPPVDLAGTLSLFQDFSLKQAQIDNLREQRRILTSTADMKYLDSLAYSMQDKEHDKTDRLSSLPLIKRNYTLTQLERTQAEVLRLNTDNALKAIQLAWMKKLGVTGLGGAISALQSIGKLVKR